MIVGKRLKEFTSWHVAVAAEAIAAALFARCGLDVSVQYGANQPEYDLIIARGERMLKVSVKGSQDGGWGLTQSLLRGEIKADYHGAIDRWLERHRPGTILCFVQFQERGPRSDAARLSCDPWRCRRASAGHSQGARGHDPL
jgi:hypothetical protein